MLSGKVLTPRQIWQDYNPNEQPLELLIKNIVVKDGIVIKHITFTSEIIGEEKVKAYATFYYPENALSKLPSLVICNHIENELTDSILCQIAKEGYFVATFDYYGKKENHDNYTIYPNSLNYCNYELAGSKLYKVNASIYETPIYHWAIIAKRVVTLIEQDSICDKEKIGIIGILHGCNIMWQVAAMDNRIKSCVSILNSGWKYESLDKLNLYDNKITDTEDVLKINQDSEEYDDIHRFIIGWSIDAYSGLVTCPTLLVSATYGQSTIIEKVGDTYDRLQSTKKAICATISSDLWLPEESLNTVFRWLNATLALTEPDFPETPTISATINQNIKFKFDIDNPKDVIASNLIISHGEDNPLTRKWNTIPVSLNNKGTGTLSYPIEISGDTVYAFLNITYSNFMVLSSKVLTIDTATYDTLIPTGYKKSRIIYEKDMGTAPFILSTTADFTNQGVISIGSGALGLQGLTTTAKSLITYNIGTRENKGEKNYLLHIDLFSQHAKDIDIQLIVEDEDHNLSSYNTTIAILNNEEWNSFSLSKEVFKNNNFLPLNNWENVKALIFNNIDNVLINNIIWI